MIDLIARLQDMHHRQNRHSYSIGHYWNAVEEAADELERLRNVIVDLQDERDNARAQAIADRAFQSENARLCDEVAASHEESRTLAIQLTERQKEISELRARIEAAVQFTITKRLRRTDGLLRILRGEEKP